MIDSMWWYSVLDKLFLFFHFTLVVFILLGWIWASRLHLVVASMVMASWFLLGLWYGLGYCPCTDWHWMVKRELGESNLPASYVKYYLDGITGVKWDARAVDWTVAAAGVGSFCLSLWVNRRRRTSQL